MAEVFISHSSDTKDEAGALAAALRERGVQVWLDQFELSAGTNWQAEMDSALKEAACIAVVVGPEQEHDSTVRNEWSQVLQKAWTAPRTLLVPVLVRDAGLPPFLSHWQYLRTNGDWDRVAEEIAASLRGRSSALQGEPPEAAVYRRQALDRIRRLKAEVAASADLRADLAI